MKQISDPHFLPYLRRKWPLYLFFAIVAFVIVYFYNQRLTEFFVARSRVRAVILFLLLPLLFLLTRPYGEQRAIGFIHALREKQLLFFRNTFIAWFVLSAANIGIVFILYISGSFSGLVGFANWVYCFFFLVFMVNLFPMPPLPRQRGGQLPITVWGPRECGKTVFIGMLYDDLTGKKWFMDPTEDDAYRYIISIRGAMTGGQWPESTQPVYDGKRSAEAFTFHFARRWLWYPYFGLRYFSIHVPDPSGELFQKVEGTDTDELPAFQQSYFREMGKSGGALFIIDIMSSENKEALRKQLDACLSHLQYYHAPGQPGKKLDFPVAIGVSQVDRVYDEYIRNKDRPTEWFKNRFGEELYSLLQNRIKEFKIFYFSAIGVKPENGKMVSRTHEVNGADIPDGDLRPFGLFDPVKWLLYRSRHYSARLKPGQSPEIAN